MYNAETGAQHSQNCHRMHRALALGMSAVSPTGGLGTVWEPKEDSNGFQAHPSHASSTAVESGIAVFALSGFECASVV